jgi:hypothetical protein
MSCSRRAGALENQSKEAQLACHPQPGQHLNELQLWTGIVKGKSVPSAVCMALEGKQSPRVRR